MRKAILTVLIALILVIPAYAAEDDTAMDQPVQQEPVVVGTLEELQTAIDAAEDGDTIVLSNMIMIDETCIVGNVEKVITLIPQSGFSDNAILRIFPNEGQYVTIQNLILDGEGFFDLAAVDFGIYLSSVDEGSVIFSNVIVQNFQSSRSSIVFVSRLQAEFVDCAFYNNSSKRSGGVEINKTGTAYFDTCVFVDNFSESGGAAIRCHGDATIENCIIKDNIAGAENMMGTSGGGINVETGIRCWISDSLITGNEATIGGGINNNGELQIIDTKICGNHAYSSGDDIRSGQNTALSVQYTSSMEEVYVDTERSPIGFYVDYQYNRFDSKDNAIFIGKSIKFEKISPEDALFGVHFVFADELLEPPQEEKPTQPEPGDNGDGEDPPPEQPQPPQQPGDQTGDGDTTGEEQPPQEPTQPPENENPNNPDDGEQGQPQEPEHPPKDDPAEQPTEPEQPPEGEGNPAENPPEAPEQPVEPPKDDTTGDTPTAPDTPQQPQEPSDGNNGNNDNYTPPTDYYPIYRPLWPVVTVKPTEDSKPQTQPDSIPAPAKPQLVCNGAVIDTSRTVVLLGYGDGLIHENDPLTRAQLATIIYRLLDDESITKYNNSALAFTDVAPDAWYAPYVQTINGAGIVQGVGDGKYSPESYLTWSQIITVLTRFVEPQEYTLRYINYHGWAQEAIETAVALEWIEDNANFNPDAMISRGQLEQLINSVLALYR